MPHDDDNTAISILKEQITNLTSQLQSLTSERDEYRNSVSQLEAERDKLKAKVQDPGDIARENAELKQSIRDRTAYDKFAELAKRSGAKDGAVKHLWKLAEYQADKDEPDDQKLAQLIDGLRADADYAFNSPEPPNMREAREAAERQTREWSGKKHGLPAPTESPAGGGRSARHQGGDGTIVTAEMRADPKFMLDPKNKQLIGDAAREGRFR